MNNAQNPPQKKAKQSMNMNQYMKVLSTNMFNKELQEKPHAQRKSQTAEPTKQAKGKH